MLDAVPQDKVAEKILWYWIKTDIRTMIVTCKYGLFVFIKESSNYRQYK